MNIPQELQRLYQELERVKKDASYAYEHHDQITVPIDAIALQVQILEDLSGYEVDPAILDMEAEWEGGK